MKLNCTKLIIATMFIIPAISFAAKPIKNMPKDNSGYYSLDVGDYSKPEQRNSLLKDSSSTIELKQNAIFSITLPTNPTTGYSWGLRTLPAQLILLDSDYRQSDDCKPKTLGCGGETTYTFKALTLGTGKLVFHYSQSWKTDSSDTRTVNINVK